MKVTDAVVFKGTKSGVLIILSDTVDFETLKERLTERLAEAEKFFYAGAGVTIDVGSRVLTSGQLLEIERILGMGNGLRLVNVVHNQAQREAAAAAHGDWWGGSADGRDLAAKAWQIAQQGGAPPRREAPSPAAGPVPAPAAPSRLAQVAPLLSLPVEIGTETPGANARGAPGADVRGRQPDAGANPAAVAAARGETLLIKRTLRSGQQVRHDGNVVVLGDVNPGAEVVATGDIVVMGVLRGVAWAGCKGDLNAVVAAFRLQPTQLRIGHLISRPPDGEPLNTNQPEIAHVRGGKVIIDAYAAHILLEGQAGGQ